MSGAAAVVLRGAGARDRRLFGFGGRRGDRHRMLPHRFASREVRVAIALRRPAQQRAISVINCKFKSLRLTIN